MTDRTPAMVHVGIDLHGTLITDHPEEVPEHALRELTSAMQAVRGRLKLYACTGNDLGFLERKLPHDVLALLDGAVLETGCVTSDLTDERVLVAPAVVARVKELEAQLRTRNFDWVYKFARRLATITLFWRRGLPTDDFTTEVADEVARLGFADEVKVTHSSVAVDIIPVGFDKLTGLRGLAHDEPTVGIADSMNDLELVRGADCAFLPANASPQLLRTLAESHRRVQNIGEASGLHADSIILCDKDFTDAVSQSLRFLAQHVPFGRTPS